MHIAALWLLAGLLLYAAGAAHGAEWPQGAHSGGEDPLAGLRHACELGLCSTPQASLLVAMAEQHGMGMRGCQREAQQWDGRWDGLEVIVEEGGARAGLEGGRRSAGGRSGEEEVTNLQLMRLAMRQRLQQRQGQASVVVYAAPSAASYLDPSCDQEQACGSSEACPCPDLASALQVAAGLAGNGSDVRVAALPGYYTGGQNLQLRLGEFPVTIEAVEGEVEISCGDDSGPVFVIDNIQGRAEFAVTIDGIRISDCRKTNTTLEGTAVSVTSGATPLLRNVTVQNCTNSPIALQQSSELTVTQCLFTENVLNFGALFSLDQGCSLALHESVVQYTEGQVFGTHARSSLLIESCIVQNNTAASGGTETVAMAQGTRFGAYDSLFLGNIADSVHGEGGGLHVSNVKLVEVDNCTFVENSASFAGGLYLDCTASIGCSLHDSGFYNNIGNLAAGGLGLSARGGDDRYEALVFEGNVASFGGAVLLVGDTEMDGVVFQSNRAGLAAGGVLSFSGKHTLTNCTFDRNVGLFVGGAGTVWGASAISLVDPLVVGNQSPLGWAGGFSVSNFGSLRVSGGLFEKNLASTLGGAIAVEFEGAMGADGVRFLRNNATSQGGSIALLGPATSNVTSCSFELNRSLQGGAIYAAGASASLVYNSTFQRNIANSYGGALYLDENSRAQILDCQVQNNDALTGGGGIYSTDEAAPVISGCVIADNVSSNGGGALVGDQSTAVIADSAFLGNSASSSGGGFGVRSFASPSVRNCTFEYNKANSLGGGIALMDQSNSTIRKCFVGQNTSPTNGGGLYSGDGSGGLVADTIFAGNHAASNGGAAYMSVTSSVGFENVMFFRNEAGTNGGAVSAANNCTSVFSSCTFRENSGISGGAVDLHDHCSPVFESCVFENNTSTSNGGATFSSSSAIALFRSCHFVSNSIESGNGGAVSLIDFSFVAMLDCQLEWNSATTGGALNIGENTAAHIWDSRFFNNTARLNGGAIIVSGSSSLFLDGSNAAENQASGNGGALSMQDESSSAISNSVFSGNSAGQGGAISMFSESQAVIEEVAVLANSAQVGGGMYAESGAAIRSSNLTLEGNAAYTAGGMFLASPFSSFTRLAVLHNNATLGAGGGMVIQPPKQSNSSVCRDCSIMFNRAKSGGGLYVLPSNPAPSSGELIGAGLPSVLNVSDPGSVMAFINPQFRGNKATNGGAIWYTNAASAGLAIGPGASFANNHALEYGGAVYISPYQDAGSDAPWLFGGVFDGNSAGFAGSTAAWRQPYPADPGAFCENCTFLTTNYAGYQNADGFATVPSTLYYSSPPPQNTFLEQTFTVTTLLQDNFGTRVQGAVLEVNSYIVTANDDTPDTCELLAGNLTRKIDEVGSAVFEQMEFEGKDGAECSLGFSVSSKPATSSIPSATFSVKLSGCPDGQKVVNGAESDSCEDVLLNPVVIAVSLIVVLFCLLLILVLLLLAGLLAYLYRRYQERRLMYLEIPDYYAYRENVTLQAILTDPEIRHIDWADIEQQERIGIGSTGVIYKGEWASESKEVALKQLMFSVHELHDDIIIQDFLVEIKLTSALKHPNIVDFYGISFPDQNDLYLVMELMHHGCMRDILDNKGPNLDMHMRLKLGLEAAEGMRYLHERNVIHRDIKSTNFMVDQKWTCKVGDLGISTIRSDLIKRKTIVGTPVYMAPEVLKGEEYSFQVDVYSFGVLLVELITGYRPYSRYKKLTRLIEPQLILRKNLRPCTVGLHPSLVQLVTDCWQSDPGLRPSFAEIVVRLERFSRGPDAEKAFDEGLEFEEDETLGVLLSDRMSFLSDSEWKDEAVADGADRDASINRDEVDVRLGSMNGVEGF